jgi:hypothetical protein
MDDCHSQDNLASDSKTVRFFNSKQQPYVSMLHSSCADTCTSASSASVLEFSSSSSPLHGVYGEEVNAAIMSKVNALGQVFFMGRRTEGNIDSSTAMQRADR